MNNDERDGKLAAAKAVGPKMTRRTFMKTGLAAAAVPAAAAAGGGGSSLKGKRLAMVIDLQRCTGCGACMVSCKSENNVQAGAAWSGRMTKTEGTFPNVRYEYVPTLCNQCENAPCVRACPTRAMVKGDGGITEHWPTKCIGCGTCAVACPYQEIWRNPPAPHRFWRDRAAVLPNCTASPEELSKHVGANVIPHYNPDKERSAPGAGLRYKGIVEKCNFCDHRVREGELPFCVESCPANARIFGDLNDPDSAASRLLKRYRAWRRKEHLGTEPRVYYIRDFNRGRFPATKGGV